MKYTKTILAGWMLWMLSASGLSAQEKFPVFLDAEIGVQRFAASAMHSVFPAGANLKIGPVFAFGDQWRLRLRPHAGVTFYSNKIDDWVTEQLLIVKLGGQVSYDVFYLGQATFFPYLAADFNWVANFDAEKEGDGDDANVTYSDSYLKGTGFSQEAGLRVQMREWYVKFGYEFFSPRLKVRKDIIDDDLASGYLTPRNHRFNFNSFNVTVGAMLSL
ncbi:hypothetical protein [Parapedobacter sp. 10938]|uniref:hypothetical protein n=1 Tax=Parapedobacter flavus TaxID=3110225 RepID=UPI002DB67F29|nr:hypothetical protein [Parapedobacter sp. 10938]MEC3881183.1 hypothetical protein [Parapedobacter sp. 10938]